VTLGPDAEQSVSILKNGSIVFSALTSNYDIWSVPLDANRGVITGAPAALVRAASTDDLPDLSADGKKLVFRTDRTGRFEQWITDLETGETRSVAEITTDFRASLSPDGSWIAFEGSRQKQTVHIVRSDGAGTTTLNGVTAPWGWSSTSKYLILSRPIGSGESSREASRSMVLLNRETGEITTLIEGQAYQGHFSPDDRWIAFFWADDIVVAPFREGSPIPKDEWVVVTKTEFYEGKPRWSPDGQLLYFTSDRDGFICIYAQRLDPATKRPEGAPLEVYHCATRPRKPMW
jgi:Tol biopolymer transport system component